MSQRLNSGVLRKNERKEGVEARPDFKGQINVDGTEYWISGWNKTNDRGAFVSLAVERIEGIKIQRGRGHLPRQSSRLVLEVVIAVDQYSRGLIRYDLR